MATHRARHAARQLKDDIRNSIRISSRSRERSTLDAPSSLISPGGRISSLLMLRIKIAHAHCTAKLVSQRSLRRRCTSVSSDERRTKLNHSCSYSRRILEYCSLRRHCSFPPEIVYGKLRREARCLSFSHMTLFFPTPIRPTCVPACVGRAILCFLRYFFPLFRCLFDIYFSRLSTLRFFLFCSVVPSPTHRHSLLLVSTHHSPSDATSYPQDCLTMSTTIHPKASKTMYAC